MALILSLESSTSVCSAAIHDQGELVAMREVHQPQSAAAQLTVLVEDLFANIGLRKSDIAAVAVSGGPGSYTGLRIGTATAKGICYALDRPLIALDSLHVLASSVPRIGDGRMLCPMIDARRMEVYCCLLTEELDIIEDTKPYVVEATSFSGSLKVQKIAFLGNGSSKCRDVIKHPNAIFLENIFPAASAMGKLAFRKFDQQEFSDVRTFEPAYLKEFVAKTKKA